MDIIKYKKWRDEAITHLEKLGLTPQEGFEFMYIFMRQMEEQNKITPELSVFKCASNE